MQMRDEAHIADRCTALHCHRDPGSLRLVGSRSHRRRPPPTLPPTALPHLPLCHPPPSMQSERAALREYDRRCWTATARHAKYTRVLQLLQHAAQQYQQQQQCDAYIGVPVDARQSAAKQGHLRHLMARVCMAKLACPVAGALHSLEAAAAFAECDDQWAQALMCISDAVTTVARTTNKDALKQGSIASAVAALRASSKANEGDARPSLSLQASPNHAQECLAASPMALSSMDTLSATRGASRSLYDTSAHALELSAMTLGGLSSAFFLPSASPEQTIRGGNADQFFQSASTLQSFLFRRAAEDSDEQADSFTSKGDFPRRFWLLAMRIATHIAERVQQTQSQSQSHPLRHMKVMSGPSVTPAQLVEVLRDVVGLQSWAEDTCASVLPPSASRFHYTGPLLTRLLSLDQTGSHSACAGPAPGSLDAMLAVAAGASHSSRAGGVPCTASAVAAALPSQLAVTQAALACVLVQSYVSRELDLPDGSGLAASKAAGPSPSPSAPTPPAPPSTEELNAAEQFFLRAATTPELFAACNTARTLGLPATAADPPSSTSMSASAATPSTSSTVPSAVSAASAGSPAASASCRSCDRLSLLLLSGLSGVLAHSVQRLHLNDARVHELDQSLCGPSSNPAFGPHVHCPLSLRRLMELSAPTSAPRPMQGSSAAALLRQLWAFVQVAWSIEIQLTEACGPEPPADSASGGHDAPVALSPKRSVAEAAATLANNIPRAHPLSIYASPNRVRIARRQMRAALRSVLLVELDACVNLWRTRRGEECNCTLAADDCSPAAKALDAFLPLSGSSLSLPSSAGGQLPAPLLSAATDLLVRAVQVQVQRLANR